MQKNNLLHNFYLKKIVICQQQFLKIIRYQFCFQQT